MLVRNEPCLSQNGYIWLPVQVQHGISNTHSPDHKGASSGLRSTFKRHERVRSSKLSLERFWNHCSAKAAAMKTERQLCRFAKTPYVMFPGSMRTQTLFLRIFPACSAYLGKCMHNQRGACTRACMKGCLHQAARQESRSVVRRGKGTVIPAESVP